MKQVTIELPFPEMFKSSIHGNGNRYAKAKTIKQRRSDAAWRVFEQYPGVRLNGAFAGLADFSATQGFRHKASITK